MQSHLPQGTRAVNIVRVSEVGDRSGPSFSSPTVQRRQSAEWAQRYGIDIIETFEELNVSGGVPLYKRKGLRRGVEMVENGQADMVLFAFFDRSFRDVAVQFETVDRIEESGGQVWAADFGRITAETAAQWATQAHMGVSNEMMRRSTGEKVKKAHREAVERGVPPFGWIVRGYRRGTDGRLVVEETEAPLITEAFGMRANGVPLRTCQRFLASKGIALSYSSIKALFKSRVPLGEIHAGKNVNREAHVAIVDPVTWQRVQRQAIPRGRPPLDETRLLAHLGGLLRCGSCNTVMSASSSKARTGAKYRHFVCGRKPDCPHPTAISESLLEKLVYERWIADYGHRERAATLDVEVQTARNDLAQAQAQYDDFVDAFGDDTDMARVKARRITLRQAIDDAVDRLSRLTAAAGPSGELLLAGRDLKSMSLSAQRDLLRAAYSAILVFPSTTRIGNPLALARARLEFKPLQ